MKFEKAAQVAELLNVTVRTVQKWAKDGKVVFGALTFETAGAYNYVVYENEVDDMGVTVDTTEYAVKVVVTDNLDGTYSVEYLYNNETEEVEEIVFNNKYTEPTPNPKPAQEKEHQSPKTNDTVNLTDSLAVMFISGAILFVGSKKFKRLSK